MAEYNENFHNNANPSIYDNAHYLRQAKTAAEEKLWRITSPQPLSLMRGALVCIEADGGIHKEKDIAEYDMIRTKVLNDDGITVLRFTNEEIIDSIKDVISTIEKFAMDEQCI